MKDGILPLILQETAMLLVVLQELLILEIHNLFLQVLIFL